MSHEPLTDAELAELEQVYLASPQGKWQEIANLVRDEHDHDILSADWPYPWKRFADEEWTDEESKAGHKRRSVSEVYGTCRAIAAMHNAFPRLLATIREARVACAKVAEGEMYAWDNERNDRYNQACRDIADAIRRGK